ncbi:MAG: RNA chaperone Hfq [Blastocatellales bacterium]|nr:RNA chaperone Hfq [Blastocatellales bacterium]
MENTAQTTQNVQDGFLNTLRRDRTNVTIYLIGGVKLTGRIRSFDKFSVVLESGNLEQLIFKHAISTISVPRSSFHHSRSEGHAHTHSHSAPPAPHTPQTPPAPPAPPAAPTGGGSPTGESGS